MNAASCECGNIGIEWDTSVSQLVARMCGCDYCTLQKGEFVSDPNSTVTFQIADISKHNIATHGHGTANFHECTNCGVIIVTSEIDGELYCVINAKALHLKYYTLDTMVKDYSGETVSARLSRRKNNWCKARDGS